jgi:hypothetical protein
MHPDAEKIVRPFLEAVDQSGAGEYSAVLYGSAARGDYVAGRSDVNLMLVFARLDPDTLHRLAGPFARWPRDGVQPPLIISAAEWARASDVFPLEITDMRAGYEVLRGGDPLAGVAVRPAELRHALERELRGKLLRLRQGYVAAERDPGMLGELALASVPTILVLLRGLLALARRPVPPARSALVQEAAAVAGFDPEAVLLPISHRGDRRWRCSAAEFERYLTAVEHTAAYVDNLHPGDAG